MNYYSRYSHVKIKYHVFWLRVCDKLHLINLIYASKLLWYNSFWTLLVFLLNTVQKVDSNGYIGQTNLVKILDRFITRYKTTFLRITTITKPSHVSFSLSHKRIVANKYASLKLDLRFLQGCWAPLIKK